MSEGGTTAADVARREARSEGALLQRQGTVLLYGGKKGIGGRWLWEEVRTTALVRREVELRRNNGWCVYLRVAGEI